MRKGERESNRRVCLLFVVLIAIYLASYGSIRQKHFLIHEEHYIHSHPAGEEWPKEARGGLEVRFHSIVRGRGSPDIYKVLEVIYFPLAILETGFWFVHTPKGIIKDCTCHTFLLMKVAANYIQNLGDESHHTADFEVSDQWGTPMRVVFHTEGREGCIVYLTSAGLDRVFGTDDDFSNSFPLVR